MKISNSRQQFVGCILALLLNFSPVIAQTRGRSRSDLADHIAATLKENQPAISHFHWSTTGQSLAYIKPAPPKEGRSLQQPYEIWTIDLNTQPRLLLSSSKITEAIGTLEPPHNAEEADKSVIDPSRLDYLWSKDDHAVILVTPNLFVSVDLESGKTRKIYSSKEILSSVQLSPNGRYLSFIRDHSLWLLNLASGSARRLSPQGTDTLRQGEPDWLYQNEWNLASAYWWSPDSSSIAYFESDDRATAKYTLHYASGDQRTITYPVAGGKLPIIHLYLQSIQSTSGTSRRAIDTGSASGYILGTTWLPNSKQLAFELLSRDQKHLDLHLADIATGKARAILSETDNYWINLGEAPRFLRDSRRFLWTSERSGFRQLYLYDIQGHQIAQLTHGNWEVTSPISINETASAVYFTATEKSPLERHLYRVNLDGSGFARITSEAGTHELTASPQGDAFLDIYSSRSTKPLPQLLRTDGSKPLPILEASQSAATPSPAIDFLTVKMHMGTEVNAMMIRPPNFDPAHKYPVVVYIDNSPGHQVVRDAWGDETILWLRFLAGQGFLVYAQDGQGTSGRGHLFEEPLHLRLSSQEMADQRDGIRYLRSLPYIDADRIGIYGWGYGGFLALHAMLDLPIAYKAGIAGAPITDWRLYDAAFAERYLADSVGNQDGYLSSSPSENAKNLRSPLLIVQGVTDEKVHIENSLSLLNEFLETSKYPSVMFVPDRGFTFDDPEAKIALYRTMTEFFLKNLASEK